MRRIYRPIPFDGAAIQLGNIPIGSNPIDVSGTLSVTEANDTPAIVGVEIFSGTGSQTETNDTSTASGALIFSGTLAVTETNDSVSASGAESITGTVAVSESNDAASGAGTETIEGTVSAVSLDSAAAGSGTLTIAGTIAANDNNDSASAAGTVLGSGASGSIESTQDDHSASAVGNVVEIAASTTAGGGFKIRTKIEKAKPQSPKWQKKLDEEAKLTEKLSQLYERIQNGYVPEEPKVKEILEEIVMPASEKFALPVFDYRGLATNANKLRTILSEYIRLQEIMQDEEDILLLMA